MNLSGEQIALLQTRTEGWIAGLKPAGFSMHGHDDSASFITSFTGSHRFIFDYLMEQVLLNDRGETILRGHLTDQSALHGVLNKIRDLGLILVSVNQVGEPGSLSSGENVQG
ncbi:MAG TPA: hypothetical protein VMS73_02795 [Anaerolineaceae bacterium]|nr:hypothetical protein [Anaerolineaceae bacterium]